MSKRGARGAGEGRTGHSALRVGVPAEGSRGALSVAPAALGRRPGSARAAAGSLAVAGTAHLAHPARRVRAPPTGRRELQSVGRGGGGVCRREGRGVAPSAEGGVLCGRRAPGPLPERTGRRGGGGAGRGGALAGPPREGERGAARRGFPHRPASTGGPGPPRAGRGMGACRKSPFVLRGVGRSGDQGALSSNGLDGARGLPSPGAPSPASPSAATAGLLPPLLPPAPAARPPFLLAPGRRQQLAEPRGPASESAPSWGPPGPAHDPAGGAPSLGTPSFF